MEPFRSKWAMREMREWVSPPDWTGVMRRPDGRTSIITVLGTDDIAEWFTVQSAITICVRPSASSFVAQCMSEQ